MGDWLPPLLCPYGEFANAHRCGLVHYFTSRCRLEVAPYGRKFGHRGTARCHAMSDTMEIWVILGGGLALSLFFLVGTLGHRRLTSVIAEGSPDFARRSVELVAIVGITYIVLLITGVALLVFVSADLPGYERNVVVFSCMGIAGAVAYGVLTRRFNKNLSQRMYRLSRGRHHPDENVAMYSEAFARWSWLSYLGAIPPVIILTLHLL